MAGQQNLAIKYSPSPTLREMTIDMAINDSPMTPYTTRTSLGPNNLSIIEALRDCKNHFQPNNPTRTQKKPTTKNRIIVKICTPMTTWSLKILCYAYRHHCPLQSL